jgi:hypothetical protein
VILNIIDRRSSCYRWQKVNAIIEATWHDNSVPGSDQAEVSYELPDFEEREGLSVLEAVQWASDVPTSVTLYLYDLGHPESRPLSAN